MKTIQILVLSLILNEMSLAQTLTKTLKVLEIKTYTDGYLIRGADMLAKDTINLLTAKKKLWCKAGYKQIRKDSSYLFEFDNLGMIGAIPPGSGLAVRLRHTVVWTSSEDETTMPLFLHNTVGLWVRARVRNNKK